jgi:hypothetical protein
MVDNSINEAVPIERMPLKVLTYPLSAKGGCPRLSISRKVGQQHYLNTAPYSDASRRAIGLHEATRHEERSLGPIALASADHPRVGYSGLVPLLTYPSLASPVSLCNLCV